MHASTPLGPLLPSKQSVRPLAPASVTTIRYGQTCMNLRRAHQRRCQGRCGIVTSEHPRLIFLAYVFCFRGSEVGDFRLPCPPFGRSDRQEPVFFLPPFLAVDHDGNGQSRSLGHRVEEDMVWSLLVLSLSDCVRSRNFCSAVNNSILKLMLT